jgi:hypothetical protein
MGIIKVWYKVDNGEPSEFEVKDNADVDDLKRAVKRECPNILSGVDAISLNISLKRAHMMDPAEPVPVGTTSKTPLVVVPQLPPPHNVTGIPERFVSILLTMAMKNMEIGWERMSSECTTIVDSTQARKASTEFYGLDSEKHCQILGTNTKRVQNVRLTL